MCNREKLYSIFLLISIRIFSQKAFKALCQSTHLYGRRLVLEWAQADEGIEEIRKRTAKYFYNGNLYFLYLLYFNKYCSKLIRVSMYDRTCLKSFAQKFAQIK